MSSLFIGRDHPYTHRHASIYLSLSLCLSVSASINKNGQYFIYAHGRITIILNSMHINLLNGKEGKYYSNNDNYKLHVLDVESRNCYEHVSLID